MNVLIIGAGGNGRMVNFNVAGILKQPYKLEDIVYVPD